MPELRSYDVQKCVLRIPKKLQTIMIENDTPIYIAGGFIRSIITGDKVNDIDVFAGDRETSRELVFKIANKISSIKETDNAFTILENRPNIQFIHRWTFKSHIDLINSFDFTICKSIILFNKKSKKWEGYCDDSFYPDLAAKRLVYCSPIRDEEVGGTMLRLLKYYRKGFNAPLSSVSGIISRLVYKIYIGGLSEGFDEKELSAIIRGLLIEVDHSAATEE